MITGKILVVHAVIDRDGSASDAWQAEASEPSGSPFYGLFGQGSSFREARESFARNVALQVLASELGDGVQEVRVLATTRKTFNFGRLVTSP